VQYLKEILPRRNCCSLIWLVHGDKGKLDMKSALENRISKICKTTRIAATNRDTAAHV
jgi:hypothetical protein